MPVGQEVTARFEEFGKITSSKGIIKEVYPDYVIADIEGLSNHCMFEQGFNLDCLYPAYN